MRKRTGEGQSEGGGWGSVGGKGKGREEGMTEGERQEGQGKRMWAMAGRGEEGKEVG